MNVIIIGIVGLPAKYGGFETLVEYLTRELAEACRFTVFCSSSNYPDKPGFYNHVKLEYIPLDANGPQSIIYDALAMFKSLGRGDVVLILGVSGCMFLPILRLFSKRRTIVNIDGLEWKREKWGLLAKWILKLSEKLAVRYSDDVIVDNVCIQKYVKCQYGVESTFIPYGADHVKSPELSESIRSKYSFVSEKYAFKVCRIEPENNVHVILSAFARQKDLPLVIVGNWSKSDYGARLRTTYLSNPNIHLIDPIYDQLLLDQLRANCSLYVHGHSAGGTNPSLVEAMYLGLPILAFDVDYNRETTRGRALYFKDEGDLLDLVRSTSVDELAVVGEDMKAVAYKMYTWKAVAAAYKRSFDGFA